ncbi:protein of unknown function [Paraburkholderia kururiensis]
MAHPVMPSWCDGRLWPGCSKVTAPSTQTPLRLQGYMTYTKIGGSAEGPEPAQRDAVECASGYPADVRGTKARAQQ